jgi:hypothetical protein
MEEIEGSRYEHKPIRVRTTAGEAVEATTFWVKPERRQDNLWTSAQYVGHIVMSLRSHGVPEEHVQRVIDIALETNCRAVGTPKDEGAKIESLRDREVTARRSMHPTVQPVDFIRFYNQEDYLFTDVNGAFNSRGYLTPEEFFAIIIWKAERAKGYIKKKLQSRGPGLPTAVEALTRAIHDAGSDKDRLRLLLNEWGFLLPMVIAILTVLYPDRFTVYDFRAREELRIPDFAGRKAEIDRYFNEYLLKVEAVSAASTLRDKDRYLWGKSAYQSLQLRANVTTLVLRQN